MTMGWADWVEKAVECWFGERGKGVGLLGPMMLPSSGSLFPSFLTPSTIVLSQTSHESPRQSWSQTLLGALAV